MCRNDPEEMSEVLLVEDNPEDADLMCTTLQGQHADAPSLGEARSSQVPAEFGGNMDAPEVNVGNTVYLPVSVPGALLYMGDGHAAMGDGEIASAAIEIPLTERVQVSVIKGKKIGWPRFESNDSIMAVGAYRELEDVMRIALAELIGWIHGDYGLSSGSCIRRIEALRHHNGGGARPRIGNRSGDGPALAAPSAANPRRRSQCYEV